MEIGKQARGIDGGTAPTYVSYRAAPLIEILLRQSRFVGSFVRNFAGAGKIATRDVPPAIATYLYCNVGGLYLSLCLSTCFESNIPRFSGLLPMKLEISSALSKSLAEQEQYCSADKFTALTTGRIMRFKDASSKDKRD